MWKIIASTAVLLVGCSVRPAAETTAYEGATKLNSISVGMSKAEMLSVMGVPTSTSASRGVECSEYMLLAHSENYRSRSPTRYFVTLTSGRVIEYGEGSCSPYYMDQALKRESLDSFDRLSIGMTKGDVLRQMAVDPYGPGFPSMYGLECLEYFYPAGNGNSPHRFVSFANGKLVALERTGCGSELNGMNFVPGGKYYYLRSK
jgi:hypothetical protein